MLLTAENFYDMLNNFDLFRTLPEVIDSTELTTFQRVFGNETAGEQKNIVYVFRASNPIPRMKGESDIIYIGETKGSFKQRYLKNAPKFATSLANRMKYEHIISHYGPIRITIAKYDSFGETSEQAEEQLLWWYFQNHLELPPINYTKPKVRINEKHI